MDPAWMQLGARLSSRALRILCDSGREPTALAADPAGLWQLFGDLGDDARSLQRAVAAARGAGAPEPVGRRVRAGEAEYPRGLWDLARPPSLLWWSGAALPAAPRVAIVGARAASRNGKRFARRLACELAGAGVEIWSGLARGIDSAAHEGALQCEAGRTVAVLGSGLDVMYPRENAGLADRIRARGAVLTEFPPGTEPRREHFPQRNRILAAATHALAVIEAGERSGALTTVNWALALGRPVLVTPADPTLESALGSNELLRAGSLVLLDALDVLVALGLAVRPKKGAPPGGGPAASRPLAKSPRPAHPLLEMLAEGEAHIEDIALRWEGTLPVQAELVRLELDGLVESLPGGYYGLKTV